MTVCIAACGDDGSSVVVASDRMLSAPFLTVEFDHLDTKISQIDKRCVALSSGDALCVQEILIGGLGAANQLQNPPISTLAEQIKFKFCDVRKQRINDLILGPRGTDFDNFYRGGMINQFPRDLAMILDNQVQKLVLGTTLLVAGVDSSGAHIYSVEDPGVMQCFDRLGYHAIGTGFRHAVLKLVSLGQHMSNGLNETVFNVFCAKKVAEVAPGVGYTTTMKIVTNKGTTIIEQRFLDKMEQAFKEQANPKLQKVSDTIKDLPYENADSE